MWDTQSRVCPHHHFHTATHTATSRQVEGIPWTCDESDVRDFFKGCGKISGVRMPRWQDSGRPRGYAHVAFAGASGARAAFKRDGLFLKGRYLSVQVGQRWSTGYGGCTIRGTPSWQLSLQELLLEESFCQLDVCGHDLIAGLAVKYFVPFRSWCRFFFSCFARWTNKSSGMSLFACSATDPARMNAERLSPFVSTHEQSTDVRFRVLVAAITRRLRRSRRRRKPGVRTARRSNREDAERSS